MHIYFDESGDFNPNSRQKFASVAGVMIPEDARGPLKRDFDWFVGQLLPKEFENREPKGSRLSGSHRRTLLEILKSHRDVLLVPILVNLGENNATYFQEAPAKIGSLIESNLDFDSPLTIDDRRQLAARIRRLSAPSLIRLMSYAIAVSKAVEATVCRYFCERFHSTHQRIQVTFDRFTKADSRDELVLLDAIPGWIATWSLDAPSRVPLGLSESHPFFALYGQRITDRWKVNLRKMLAGNIDFEDSRTSWEVRLADFVASTYLRTLLDHRGVNGHRTLFMDIWQKSALPNETPLGIVSLTDRTETVPAPQQFDVFARMVLGEKKILPCE